MYVGIGPEYGKRIQDENAFMYAMERITTDSQDMEEFKKEFMPFGKVSLPDLEDFRELLVEWFYSGNWIKEEEDEVSQTESR